MGAFGGSWGSCRDPLGVLGRFLGGPLKVPWESLGCLGSLLGVRECVGASKYQLRQVKMAWDSMERFCEVQRRFGDPLGRRNAIFE